MIFVISSRVMFSKLVRLPRPLLRERDRGALPIFFTLWSVRWYSNWKPPALNLKVFPFFSNWMPDTLIFFASTAFSVASVIAPATLPWSKSSVFVRASESTSQYFVPALVR